MTIYTPLLKDVSKKKYHKNGQWGMVPGYPGYSDPVFIKSGLILPITIFFQITFFDFFNLKKYCFHPLYISIEVYRLCHSTQNNQVSQIKHTYCQILIFRNVNLQGGQNTYVLVIRYQ